MKGTRGKTKGKIVAVGMGGGEYKIMKEDGINFTQSFFGQVLRTKLGRELQMSLRKIGTPSEK